MMDACIRIIENNLHSLEYAVSYGIAVACAAIQSASNVPEIKSTSEIDADALHVFSRRISMWRSEKKEKDLKGWGVKK